MDSEIIFEASKAGELTCSFKGKYLHSKYNPLAEGEKFVQNLQADFSPLCIFVIEPALSYCADFLKKRFPSSKICAIRILKEFDKSNQVWDKVFYLDGEPPLSERLFDSLGEENLISSLVFDWNPTKQTFPDENLKIWSEIKKSILKSRDVLGTRAYFSKRWFKNALIFTSRIKSSVKPNDFGNFSVAEKAGMPIVIVSSGPSLETSIPFLKKHRDSFFLLAVSSSFMPLLRNEIVPDMVISTDGGFWAKKHLAFPKNECDTIFALSAESAVPKDFFETKKILPMVYTDGASNQLIAGEAGKSLFRSWGFDYTSSLRCGTVAGTALDFALNLTSGNVYLCGQDLAPAPGFQHAQPNALEIENSARDFRFRNAETRISSSRFNSAPSLEIYRNWFITNSPLYSKRVFRLSDNFSYEFSLGKITDVDWEEFENKEHLSIQKSTKIKKIKFRETKSDSSRERKKADILDALKKLSEKTVFTEEIFPLESIQIKRSLAENEENEKTQKLKEKITNFMKECEKLI